MPNQILILPYRNQALRAKIEDQQHLIIGHQLHLQGSRLPVVLNAVKMDKHLRQAFVGINELAFR